MHLLHQKAKKVKLLFSLAIRFHQVESITETVSEPIKQNIFEGHSESWVGEFCVAEKGTCTGGRVIFAGHISNLALSTARCICNSAEPKRERAY